MTLLWILTATVLVGLISLIGVFTVGFKIHTKKITFFLISLASGSMLGGAFFHLIPESLEQGAERALPTIGVGVFVFFILEKFFIWRHCHLHQNPAEHGRPTAASMILASDAIHNFIDGVIIASAFLASPHVGVSVSLAIMFHEIPQELGDFGVMVHCGFSVKKALVANLLTATTAIAGALGAYFFIEAMPLVQMYILPLAAGGVLYIALADLIPQLHERVAVRETAWQILLLAGGFIVMLLLRHH